VGLSDIFPNQIAPTHYAIDNNSLYDVVMFYDLELSKDGVGIWQLDLRLENITYINFLYTNQ